MSDVAVTLPVLRTVNVALAVPTVGLIAPPLPTVDLTQPASAAATVVQPPLPTVGLTATTGPNEIVISQTEPTDPFVEMWWRPDTVAATWDSGMWDSASWM